MVGEKYGGECPCSMSLETVNGEEGGEGSS